MQSDCEANEATPLRATENVEFTHVSSSNSSSSKYGQKMIAFGALFVMAVVGTTVFYNKNIIVSYIYVHLIFLYPPSSIAFRSLTLIIDLLQRLIHSLLLYKQMILMVGCAFLYWATTTKNTRSIIIMQM